MHVILELTDKCNLKCAHCLKPESIHGDMPFGRLEEAVGFINRVKKDEEVTVALSGGEITLYPYLKDAISLFAQNNINIDLLTNGVFAEENNIPKESLNLTNEELSRVYIKKIKQILETGIGTRRTMRDLEEELTLRDGLVDYATHKQNISPEMLREFLNIHLVMGSFYSWTKEMDILREDGNHVIQGIYIGDDQWHLSERRKKGYTENIIPNRKINKPLRKSVAPIKISATQGIYPSFIGRAHKAKKFYEKDPLARERKNCPKSTLVSECRKAKDKTIFTGDNYKELMNILYKSNWDNIPRDGIGKRFFENRFRICGCITSDSVLINPSGEMHACSYSVLPHAKILGGKINEEYSKIEKAFHEKGGPFAVARHYKMPEDQIYKTFMDKGPCGLCYAAVNSKK